MEVRVDNEAHRLVGDALKSGLDFLSQRCVFIVDNYDAVLADRCANVSSRAFQHVDVARYLRDFDLDFAEVLILRDGEACRQQTRTESGGEVTHEEFSSGAEKLARDCKWLPRD
mgnify:CR=1 FL=1